MENENLVIKTVYEIIKSLVPDFWTNDNLPKTEDELKEFKSLRIELTEHSFPKTLSLKFEELPIILKRLDNLGLIKFNETMESKIIRNPYSRLRQKTQVFTVWFLKFANTDEILKENKAKNLKLGEARKIKKITIIRMDDGKNLVAVNDNFEETKDIKDSSDWWQIFIKEIEERNMRPETRTNVKEISKDMVDYFNYNTKKCPIYMNEKYKPTNIFIGRDIDAKINSDIKTEIIKEKKYLTRKNKKNKK